MGEVDEKEVFFEVFGLGDELAVGVEGAGVTVEDEFVVGADLVDVDDGHVPAFGLVAEELVAVGIFAEDEGRCGDVEEDFSFRWLRRGARDGVEMIERALQELFIVPEVLADGDADGVIVDGRDFGIGAGLEVAGFVEDIVGGEEALGSVWRRFSPSRTTATALCRGRPRC